MVILVVVMLQETIKKIYVDNQINRYIALIVDATRHHRSVYLGASPRGSLALFRTAQAHALIYGRDFVLPDDVKNLAEVVLSHRIVPIAGAARSREDKDANSTIVSEILDSVHVPGAIPK